MTQLVGVCDQVGMPHKNKARSKAYQSAWRRRKHEESKDIECACGCGGILKEIGLSGKKQRYLPRHRFGPDHVPPRVAKARKRAKTVECACGCGQVLTDRDDHGRKRKYIFGHAVNRNPEYTTVELPPSTLVSSLHPNAIRGRKRAWVAKMKALRAYGGDPPKCACCGEHRLKFLAIDHTNGSGSEHRRGLKKNERSGRGWYEWLLCNFDPTKFRVLCHNCNMAIGFWGICAHEDER